MAAWQRLGRRTFVLGLFLALAGFAATNLAGAAESKSAVASLDLVPADAAFYATMLRNREQVELVGKSRAWAKLMEMPSLQMALAFYNIQAGDPTSAAGKFAEALKDAEVQKAIALAGDVCSDEIFGFGDKTCVDLLTLTQEFNAANREATISLVMQDVNPSDMEKLQSQRMLKLLVKNVDRIKIPGMMFGFKVHDKALAEEEINKLEALVKQALEENPDFKGKFQRQNVAGSDFLTLTFDGTMIPYDEAMEKAKEFEENAGDVEKIVEAVKKLTCTFSVGLRGDYLLVAMGPSTDAIANLGKGETLGKRPELKPLEKFLDKPLTHISYISKEMNRRLMSTGDDLDSLVDLGTTSLQSLAKQEKITDEQAERIAKDAAALVADVKKKLPTPGAAISFRFLTDKGVEGYGYNDMGNLSLDGAKPLSLLAHLGGDPMLAFLARGKHSPEDYAVSVKWMKTAYAYFEEFALPEMQEEERAKFEKVMEILKPAFERIDKANRELLLPAMADGQCGMVLDARMKGKKFHEEMPEASVALPLPQPAFVLGISNREKFVAGLREYRDVINSVLDACRGIEGSDMPEWLRIGEAEKTDGKAGNLYSYPMPKEWELDKRLAFTLGVSDKMAVFALSKGHTERLLTSKALKSGGVFGDGKNDRPRATAAVVDFAAMLGAMKPWIDYAFEQASGDEGPGMAVAAAQGQVQTVLDVLTVFRTLTAESYFDGGTLVTHSVFEISDLPE